MKKIVAIVVLAVTAVSATQAQAELKHAPACHENDKLSVDMPVMTLMANEPSRTIMNKVLPGIEDRPGYDTYKAMPLSDLQPLSRGLITEAMLTKIQAELDAYYAAQ